MAPKVARRIGCAIDQHIRTGIPEQEIEHRLALGAQKRAILRVSGQNPPHVLRHQPLQKLTCILACFGGRQTDNATIEQTGVWHR